MKVAIILSQADPEMVFNALRLANFALKAGDAVDVFLKKHLRYEPQRALEPSLSDQSPR
jgi:peroxiredoxin family protein